MNGPDAVMRAREKRWQRRLALATRYNAPVLTLKLNIPGPDKNPPEALRAWRLLAARTRQALRTASLAILEKESGPDGPALHLVVHASSVRLKQLGCALEQADALGRLADLDVMTPAGTCLSRSDLGLPPRSCLLCGREAALCIRGQRHPPEAVLDRVLQEIRGGCAPPLAPPGRGMIPLHPQY